MSSKRPRKSLVLLPYARVSSLQQSQTNLSLDAQSDAMRAYASAKGFALHPSPFMDECSAWGRNSSLRPGYRDLIREARRLDAGILVAKVDRLSRSVKALCAILKNDIPVYSADMGRVSKRKLKQLVCQAELEGDMISRKRKEAHARPGNAARKGACNLTKDDRRRGTVMNGLRCDENVRAVATYLHNHPDVASRTRREIVRHLNDAGVRRVKSFRKELTGPWTERAIKSVWPKVSDELELLRDQNEPED